jgi:hypothetical protein
MGHPAIVMQRIRRVRNRGAVTIAHFTGARVGIWFARMRKFSGKLLQLDGKCTAKKGADKRPFSKYP